MTLTKTQRLKALLSNGYFPEELPPPFNTRDFGTYRNSLKAAWPNQHPPKTIPEIYSLPRIGRKRRSLSIINPISQFFLAAEISENWATIKKYIYSSKTALEKPTISKDGRAVQKPDFSRIQLMRLQTAGDYNQILLSDISRFYGTIYTHTLPWALHGKAWCKANLNTPALKGSLGNRLDELVRKGQDNQTIGIPIGPDTSRILSEIIAVGVEERFLELNKSDGLSAFRFIDDWFIGHDGADAAETAIRHLAQACADFELELNLEKTEILSPVDPVLESWPSELRELMIAGGLTTTHKKATEQASALNRFFSHAYQLARSRSDQNIMDYTLKLARSFRIVQENYFLFESFVLRAARAYPITLPTVTQILINYRSQGAPISRTRCRKLIHDVVRSAAPLRHNEEVAWALFLAKGLGIEVRSDELESVCNADSSVWALLCLDLDAMGLIDGTLDKKYWSSLATEESLTDATWLLAYEAVMKGWLTPATNYLDAHPWFGPMARKKVSFYDTNANVQTFQKSRNVSIAQAKRRLSAFPALLSSLMLKYQ